MSQPTTTTVKCPACDKPLSRRFGTPETGEFCEPCIDAVLDRFEHKNGKHLPPECSLAGPILELLYCRGMLRDDDLSPDEDNLAEEGETFPQETKAVVKALLAVGRPVVFIMQNQGFRTSVEELCSLLPNRWRRKRTSTDINTGDPL